MRPFSGLLPASLLICFTLLALAVSASTDEPSPSVDEAAHHVLGPWQGTLVAGENRLRLVLHWSQSADGALEATLDSLDQGIEGIPVAAASLDGDAVHLDIKAIQASFEGRLAAPNRIEGDWKQSGYTFPLTFEKATEDDPEGR